MTGATASRAVLFSGSTFVVALLGMFLGRPAVLPGPEPGPWPGASANANPPPMQNPITPILPDRGQLEELYRQRRQLPWSAQAGLGAPAATGSSEAGASGGSAWRCGSQSSQRGRYQLRWPSKLRVLGRMTRRISVASRIRGGQRQRRVRGGRHRRPHSTRRARLALAAASLSVRPTEPRPSDGLVTAPVSWAASGPTACAAVGCAGGRTRNPESGASWPASSESLTWISSRMRTKTAGPATS